MERGHGYHYNPDTGPLDWRKIGVDEDREDSFGSFPIGRCVNRFSIVETMVEAIGNTLDHAMD